MVEGWREGKGGGLSVLFAQAMMCKGPIRRGKLQNNGTNALASRFLVVALPGEEKEDKQGGNPSRVGGLRIASGMKTVGALPDPRCRPDGAE